MDKKCLLIVDDDERVREATRLAFKRYFDILDASNEKGALEHFDSAHPDVVFLDIDLGGIPQGWDILRKIRERDTSVVILMISGKSSEKANPLMKQADGFFEKPVDLSSILDLLEKKKVLLARNAL